LIFLEGYSKIALTISIYYLSNSLFGMGMKNLEHSIIIGSVTIPQTIAPTLAKTLASLSKII